MPNPETAPAPGSDTDDPSPNTEPPAEHDRSAEAETHFRLGHAYLQRQDVDEALAAFQRALDSSPGHHDARFAIAYIRNATGSHADARPLLTEIVAAKPDHADAWYQLAKADQGLGALDDAAAAFHKTLALAPEHHEAMRDLGAVLMAGGQLDEAHGRLQQALAKDPDDLETRFLLGRLLTVTQQFDDALPHLAAVHQATGDAAHGVNHASALINAGDVDAAVGVAKAVTTADPDFAEGWFVLGMALQRDNDARQAIEAFETAIRLGADAGKCELQIAAGYSELTQFRRALEIYQRLHAAQPDDLGIVHGIGATLEVLGRPEEALPYFEEIARRRPDDADSWNNLAYALDRLDRCWEAVVAVDRALKIEPDHVRANLIAANCYLRLRSKDKALQYAQRALDAVGDDTERLFVIGELYESIKLTEKAGAIFARVNELDPDHPKAKSRLLDISLSLCDWSHYDAFVAGQIERAKSEIESGATFSFDVFNLQALPVSYAFMHEAARVAARRVARKELAIAAPYQHQPRPPSAGTSSGPLAGTSAKASTGGRIRLGYLLPYTNFHSLPIVLDEIVKHHDRSRFEVLGFCTQACDTSDFSREYRSHFDRFHNIPGTSGDESARLIHEAGVDVLIDVAGLTGQNCMHVLAHRPAPVQAHFLGYSITTGADYIDYLITDRIYIPPEWQQHCSEQLVYLPDTFMATLRQDAEPIALKRGHFDLPDDAVVFANFNHPCKFEPKIFSAWMRILEAVPGSVMWFGVWTSATQDNLKKEAEKRGIAGDRLIFSEIVDRPVHLARLALADLALDNLYHGGGVTTVDALWVGLPVLTIRGETPGARLGATLSAAAGLTEPIVDDLETYVATAIALARDPSRLQAWKQHLLDHRDTCPLFDTGLYRTNLEQAIEAMWLNFAAGGKPQPIEIAAGPS